MVPFSLPFSLSLSLLWLFLLPPPAGVPIFFFSLPFLLPGPLSLLFPRPRMALPHLRASLDSPRKHTFSAFPANFMANFRHRHVRREYHIVVLGAGGVGKSCLTGKSLAGFIQSLFWCLLFALTARPAQFVQNIWIESYDPTIEDSYRKVLAVDVSVSLFSYSPTSEYPLIFFPYIGTAMSSRNLGRNNSVSLITSNLPDSIPGHPQTNKLNYSRHEQLATHKAHPFSRELYMKQGEGFLLVFSITSMSSLNELQELREQIIRIKDDEKVPIVIVGNKSDLEEDRAVSRSRAFALSQQWGNAPYYETSARRRANVDEAFIDLCRQIIRKDIRSNKDRDRDYGGSRKKEASGAADKRRNRRRTKMKTDCDSSVRPLFCLVRLNYTPSASLVCSLVCCLIFSFGYLIYLLFSFFLFFTSLKIYLLPPSSSFNLILILLPYYTPLHTAPSFRDIHITVSINKPPPTPSEKFPFCYISFPSASLDIIPTFAPPSLPPSLHPRLFSPLSRWKNEKERREQEQRERPSFFITI
ncbi:hypothetical protein TRV_08011 [Trichophyton verrucosum HKI 0517]|uniref:RAS small monomeric GTPase n=1 Tax=Trichophyton verrucosum (strain HKI 0517) TaxID=663202 RepID=D4DLD7_TRIVH|nr:uncharacterized protein TRV_08011 [Trichophyton verrucosum HKI 0517]EFE37315.1 hypothetical protein TRV_08011 [Trichophyton verrucosum HKI 0517]